MGNPFAAMMQGNTGGGMPPGMNLQDLMNGNGPSSEQMQDMLQSPMMEQLMENPDMMRTMMQLSMDSNPQLRQMMEQNPQMREVMQDPAMLEQMLQMARNPAMRSQVERNQELALAQLENMPGGFAAMSSVYHDMAPLMDPTSHEDQSTPRTNPTHDTTNDGAMGAAMANPWGRTPPSLTPSIPPASTSSGGGGNSQGSGTGSTPPGSTSSGGGGNSPGTGTGSEMPPNWMSLLQQGRNSGATSGGAGGTGSGMMPGMMGMPP